MSGPSIKPIASKVDVQEYHQNLSQIVIATTEDKLRGNLNDFKDAQGKILAWAFPAGLFISLFSTLLTASFHDAWGKTAIFWEAIFVITCALSFAWTIYAVIHALCCIKKASVDTLIRKIKNQSDEKA